MMQATGALFITCMAGASSTRTHEKRAATKPSTVATRALARPTHTMRTVVCATALQKAGRVKLPKNAPSVSPGPATKMGLPTKTAMAAHSTIQKTIAPPYFSALAAREGAELAT